MVKARHNLKGQKFGDWTVLRQVEPPEHIKQRTGAFWLCRCTCGRKQAVRGSYLTSPGPRTTTRACLRCASAKQGQRQIAAAEDLTGRKFGDLLVIQRAGSTRHKMPLWRCRCFCGAIRIVARHNLKSGNTKGCGPACPARERVRYVGACAGCGAETRAKGGLSDRAPTWCDDCRTHGVPPDLSYLGKVVGRMTVLKYIGTARFAHRDATVALWWCRCACGRRVQKSAASLHLGLKDPAYAKLSCGCLSNKPGREAFGCRMAPGSYTIEPPRGPVLRALKAAKRNTRARVSAAQEAA